MKVDYPIIDSDGHIVERDEEIRKYLPEKYLRTPRALFPLEGWTFGLSETFKQESVTAEGWLRFLNDTGIAATVLYPDTLTHSLIRHVEWSVDLARAYNDWLYEHFSRQSDRLKGIALLPVQDVGAAAQELRRCVNEYGFVGGMLPTVTSPIKGLGSRDFDPLYSTAQELNTMLAVHGGAIGGMSFTDALQSYREVRALKHVIPQFVQTTNMISQGVYERFPELRVAYLEAGCGWILYLMDILDEQFERKGAQDLKKKPSAYLMSDNIFFSFEAEERLLPFFIQTFGSRKLIWASDYPHERDRSAFLDDLPKFFARKDVSDDSRRMIFYENPKRLYKIDI